MSAPAVGMPQLVIRRGESPPDFGWVPPRSKGRRAARKTRRDASRLQLHGWREVPCEAPEGYFWKRGAKLWRLYALPPGERRVEYDERHDRSIIYSGWGYVKPTYAPGDVR